MPARSVTLPIAVTADMRSRILRTIRDFDFEPTKSKPRLLMRYLAAAACFVVLMAGTMALPPFLTSLQTEHPSGVQAGILHKTVVSSLSELSQTVGFEVEELQSLPFDVTETSYAAYGDEMAEVNYLSETQSLTFRKAVGNIDCSGDYTSYPDVWVLEHGNLSVTLKGESGGYCLAIWQNDTHSYSILTSVPLTDLEWLHILETLGSYTP